MSLLLTLLFTIVSYNCENLFDCRHDSLKNDWEFCEDSSRNWHFGRYWKKLNNIGRVIQQCGCHHPDNHQFDGAMLSQQRGGHHPDNHQFDGAMLSQQRGGAMLSQQRGGAMLPQQRGGAMLPDIVALLEVENDSTLFMLTKRSLLKGAGYKYVMTNSLDARGIDVAMIYNPLTFRLERSYSIRPDIENLKTRDILYAKGVMRARDTLHIFVVHAPSRRNGKSATEGYRLQVERRMMQSVDSIRGINPDAKIVLMGDFNDYSNDRALKDIVSRGFVETSKGVRGLNYEKTGVSGTYKYQGAWNSLDHIFLSTGAQQQVERCFIYDAAWLLEEDNQGGYKPFRTYLGPRYHDGVSDHLPIVLQLKLE